MDFIRPFPCSEHQACLYVTYLSRSLKFSSIKNYLSGLNDHLLSLGYQGLNYAAFELKSCLQGIKLSLGTGVRQAEPLLPALLTKLFVNMFDTLGHTSVRAAMLLSFRALLRKGHVTNSHLALLRKDFSFHHWGMTITITNSKTASKGALPLILPVVALDSSQLCAVFWVRKHFLDCPAPGDAQAFRLPRSGNSVPLSYNYYTKVLKNLCAKADLESAAFSSHSLRRGGATFMNLVGISLDEIKDRGSWKSDAVLLYIKTPFSEKLKQEKELAKLLNKL